MRPSLYIYLSFLLFISACKKDEKQHSVIYKVTVIAGNPSYSVNYSGNNNSSISQGPFSATTWISPKIADKVNQDVASFTLSSNGGGSFNMYIYVDGFLENESRMDDPYGPKTLSVTIYD